MTRRLGVFVAMLAFASTAVAGKAKPHSKAATKAEAKKPAPPADEAPTPNDPAADPDAADGSAAADEDPLANVPHITGPQLVDLGNSAEIDLPAGMVLFEQKEAQELVKMGGNSGDGVVAAIIQPGTDWAVIISYEDIGYVNDKDADELDANALLDSYKKGTAEQNQRRKSMGVPELIIDGWSEKPHYEKAQHHLLWGLDAHDSDNKKVINFITRTLGRNGFLSIDLIDAPETIAQSKVAAAPIVAATRFKAGARYEDHKDGDKDSGMGLRALVLGGAGIAVLKAAKAGIFIKLLLVFKKLFIVVFAAIGGFFKWLFGKKKKQADAMPPSDPMPPSDDPMGGDGQQPPPNV